MHCRYVRVRAKCSKTAADWQMQFTQHVTNTIPNLYQYVVYPNGSNATDIAKCENLQPGYYGGIVCIIIIIIITPNDNALPDDLRDQSLSADIFRKRLKTHLFRNALGHVAH